MQQAPSVVLAAVVLAAAAFNQLSAVDSLPSRARGLMAYLAGSEHAGAGSSMPLHSRWWPAAAAGTRGPPAALYSRLWGVMGESWTADGPIPDFSFAGYRGGTEPIPGPPLTRNFRQFKRGHKGRSSTEALEAMVAWANKQPPDAGWVVLYMPVGTFTIERPITITRPKTVLRGAGRTKTTLYLPNSLAGAADGKKGAVPMPAAWINVEGGWEERQLARVVAAAPRGASTLQVDDPSGLKAGQLVTLVYEGDSNGSNGGGGDGESMQEAGEGAVRFTSRVLAVTNHEVTLERPLPLAVRPELEPVLVRRTAAAHDVGIERLSLRFKWQPYAGHAAGEKQGAGRTGVRLSGAADCWVSDVGVVNGDEGVAVEGSERVTVRLLDVSATKPRHGGPERAEGHWGVRVGGGSADILVTDFLVHTRMVHGVGVRGAARLCVFERGFLTEGNLELHSPAASQILFTDVHVGDTPGGFASASPPSSRPNTGLPARTVFWNVRSYGGTHLPPRHSDDGGGGGGSCGYGSELTFVGVKFELAAGSSTPCQGWHYEPGPITPPNLAWAQRVRRRSQQAQAAAGGEGGAAAA